ERAGAYGLLALSLVAAGAAYRVPERMASLLLSSAVAPLAAAGAWALVRDQLSEAQQPAAVVAVALLALQVCSLLPHDRRRGPVLGSLAVAAVALLTQTESVVLAVAGPFSWLAHPWASTRTSARLALSADLTWKGSALTVVVLLAAAGCAVAAGALLDELTVAAVPAAVLLVLSALVLPLGLDTTYHQALALLVAIGSTQAVCGALLGPKHPGPGLLLTATGFATAVLAAVWSTAEQDATLVTLPAVALLAAALSYQLPGVLTGATALLAGAELAAFAAGQDLAPEQVGGMLLVAPAACVGLTFLLKGAHRLGLEGAGAVLAAVTVLLAVDDPGWFSWTLAVDGLLCLAVAIRPDRRVLGLAGGLLLSASSWVRLADAGVTAPEAYVAPLALAALLFGYLRRRSDPRTGSFAAYGAGLSVALVPSLLKGLDDPTPTRGLLLLVVAGAVVVTGGLERLRAPLVIGGGVLAVDALHLVAPYASALPRWTLLAGAGTLLVVLGATYEQRLRDVARLRTSYDSWT
ncbi:MAG: integral rane protein, partial [Frankiales bacterium]|nr:integral rane protein [Frankiales bacterium]